jgi:type IV pilus assembly protein PilV
MQLSHPPVSHRTPHGAMRGFSLVEIMVAVVVICVGLLGIAKMQALAVSSTTTARLRAMAAFQAASLASAMHSNRAYWATAAAVADSPITINLPTAPATAVTVTPAGFAQLDTLCIAAAAGAVPACPNVAQLAGFDVQRWGEALVPPNGGSLLPNLQTQITCQGAVQPPSCIIQMRWTEQTGTINSSEQTLAIVDPTMTGNCPTGSNCDYYTLYVEP